MNMIWNQSFGRFCVIAVILLFQLGCTGGDKEDLQAYIDEIKATSKGHVQPLPEFEPVESFAYAATDLADPFMSWETRAAIAAKEEQNANSKGLQPDLGRRREPLEAFPLDTLRMVGTMERQGKSSALVKSPDGLVSRIVVGNHLGQNYGQVVAIYQDKIGLVEIVPDGLGSWIQREAFLALAE